MKSSLSIWHDVVDVKLTRCTIAAMPSLLYRLQMLVRLEFGQSIPTVVHTVRELQLWTKGIEWSHHSTMSSYSDWTPLFIQTQKLNEKFESERLMRWYAQFEQTWKKRKFCFSQFCSNLVEFQIDAIIQIQIYYIFLLFFNTTAISWDKMNSGMKGILVKSASVWGTAGGWN